MISAHGLEIGMNLAVISAIHLFGGNFSLCFFAPLRDSMQV
jgi:hypothetical protein